MTTINDQQLLKRFEPVLYFCAGESFFPMGVEKYVSECSLWRIEPGKDPQIIFPEGQLTLDCLQDGVIPSQTGSVNYLQFISPLNIRDLAVYQIKRRITKKEPDEIFHAGRGRLARVGYLSRLMDALFSISLLARGRVPGEAAISAALTYHKILEQQQEFRYYGRVLRDQNWIVLQYLYFYPFNNWRSGFYGANDHEADWEQVCIYLYECDGQLIPEWIACAAHDFMGDDLRRRWDDPELKKLGDHPVIYIGAGSHAAYFSPGEYLTEIELDFLKPILQVFDRIRNSVNQLLQLDSHTHTSSTAFLIPFVDYARGNGKTIGEGQKLSWSEPELINPSMKWVYEYQGLWGLFTHDPSAGENAPAGPRYNRDGTERKSWYDPVGWVGLDKVLPPPLEHQRARDLISNLQQELLNIDQQIFDTQNKLVNANIELAAMRPRPQLHERVGEYEHSIRNLNVELSGLRQQKIDKKDLLFGLTEYSKQLESGIRQPVRAHIRHAHRPETPEESRTNRIAEAWAALSVGLLMIGFIVITLFARQTLVLAILGLVGAFIFLEAIFRGKLNQLIIQYAVITAVIASLILVYQFFWFIIVSVILLAGGYIVWQNLRELWI